MEGKLEVRDPFTCIKLFRVGLGFQGFRVQGLGFRVLGLELRTFTQPF